MSQERDKQERYFTTGQALEYLVSEMKRRGFRAPEWNSKPSGPAWLRVHRESGNIPCQVEYELTRPKFSYRKQDLDDFLARWGRGEIGPGGPKADFSRLTHQELEGLTHKEVAELSGWTIKTVQRARERGDIPKSNLKAGRPPAKSKDSLVTSLMGGYDDGA